MHGTEKPILFRYLLYRKMENDPKYVTHNGKFSTFILIIQKVLHVDVNVSADLFPSRPGGVIKTKYSDSSFSTFNYAHSELLRPQAFCV